MKWKIALLVIVCGTLQAAFLSQPAYRDVLIEGIPHVEQKPDFCGEACAVMYLKKLGFDVDQDYVFNMSELDPEIERGTYTPELVTALKNIGFNVGEGGKWVSVRRIKQELEFQWQALHQDLLKGVPSIVCTRYSSEANAPEHFRLVVGYDAKEDQVIYHEPAVKNGAYQRMKRPAFFSLWPLRYRKDKWYVVRLRLEPKKIIVKSEPSKFSDADFTQHLIKLKNQVPRGFTVVVEKPFVVIGDESAAVLKNRRAAGTVRWAVNAFRSKFFENDPPRIINIWLFKDNTSYHKYAWDSFGHRPDTPYGYFSPDKNALVMNIGTGGGTLVHEMFHAFIDGNFPNCPSWFNEGYASLYEQSDWDKEGIVGLTNWRLPILQEGVKRDALASFEEFCGQNDYQFYNLDPGYNYAQARYLALYLQQEGLLVRYYQQFRKNIKEDPTGYFTLKKVLGEKDMKAFKKKWEAWVLSLSYPPSYMPKG